MYELTNSGKATLLDTMLDSLVKAGYLRKVELDVRQASSITTTQVLPIEEIKQKYSVSVTDVSDPGNEYIGNHLPIETNIESIARNFLGVCEDRKLWMKDLKAAVKEHGHDEILNSFYEWASSQGSFMGRKPVTVFLKNVGNYVTRISKPQVTSPVLDRTEQKIAYITDNAVFFTGDYRLRLSLLLKEHGAELVESAFADFYQGVDDRGIPWAARDFLQRADVMIKTIKRKRDEVARQAATLQNAYTAAAESVDPVEEEEDTGL